MEVLDLKNTVSKIKNLLDGLSIKMKRADEGVYEPEDKSITGHSEEQKEKRFKKF